MYDQIIGLLRAELLEYGGLLNLYDLQHDVVLDWGWDRSVEVGALIKIQLRKLRASRFRRKNLLSKLTPDMAVPAELHRSIPLFPQPMRPLVEALADEVTRLIRQVRHRALHNRTLRTKPSEVRLAVTGSNSRNDSRLG